jgi:integrase
LDSKNLKNNRKTGVRINSISVTRKLPKLSGKGLEMARKPVSVFKRPTKTKGRFRYYVKLWDERLGAYSTPRSVQTLIEVFGLDDKRYSPNSRTGALLVGQELLRRGGFLPRARDPLFPDYCASFWDWDSSQYVQGKLARGQRIGREHVTHCAAYVKNYIRPAFPALKLSAVKPAILEAFILSLKDEGRLGNRSINAIIDAMRTPLSEAVRHGLILTNPANALHKMGNDTREKGIPTESEMRDLLALPGLDLRIRASILLGAACALRIGEVQALRLSDIGETSLTVASSWGKMEGLKETKTGRIRVVPLPSLIRDVLVKLARINPHGPEGFLIYGTSPEAPLDVRALERGFDSALVCLSLGDSISVSTREDTVVALAGWKARNITFHSLRHWSNAMLRGSVSDEKLHLLTGHTTDTMTARYDHVTESDLADLASAQARRILPFVGLVENHY